MVSAFLPPSFHLIISFLRLIKKQKILWCDANPFPRTPLLVPTYSTQKKTAPPTPSCSPAEPAMSASPPLHPASTRTSSITKLATRPVWLKMWDLILRLVSPSVLCAEKKSNSQYCVFVFYLLCAPIDWGAWGCGGAIYIIMAPLASSVPHPGIFHFFFICFFIFFEHPSVLLQVTKRFLHQEFSF